MDRGDSHSMTTAHFSEAEKRITLWGVAIVFLLSALDQTIVATAMPRIIAELNGLALYSWVTTAYLLSSTVMVPIWGKLGDLFGRKPILLAGSLFMIIVKMPKMSHHAKGRIDFIGAALIIATVVPLLLALTFGGRTYAWTSPMELGLFGGALAGLLLYVFAERFASDPILPLDL